MRIEGKKHGFHIGSGRTVKCALRISNLNVEAGNRINSLYDYRELYSGEEQIIAKNNPNTHEFFISTSRYSAYAYPKSQKEIEELKEQEREFQKRERQLLKKR